MICIDEYNRPLFTLSLVIKLARLFLFYFLKSIVYLQKNCIFAETNTKYYE